MEIRICLGPFWEVGQSNKGLRRCCGQHNLLLGIDKVNPKLHYAASTQVLTGLDLRFRLLLVFNVPFPSRKILVNPDPLLHPAPKAMNTTLNLNPQTAPKPQNLRKPPQNLRLQGKPQSPEPIHSEAFHGSQAGPWPLSSVTSWPS